MVQRFCSVGLIAPLHPEQLRQIVIASPARSIKITPLHIKSCHEITMLPSCALPCWELDLRPCSCHPWLMCNTVGAHVSETPARAWINRAQTNGTISRKTWCKRPAVAPHPFGSMPLPSFGLGDLPCVTVTMHGQDESAARGSN